MTGPTKPFHGKCPDCGSERIQSEQEDWGFPRVYYYMDCGEGHSKSTFERYYKKAHPEEELK